MASLTKPDMPQDFTICSGFMVQASTMKAEQIVKSRGMSGLVREAIVNSPRLSGSLSMSSETSITLCLASSSALGSLILGFCLLLILVGFPLGRWRGVRLSTGHRQKRRRSRGQYFIFTAPVEGGGEWVQYITNEEDNKNHLALFTEFRGRGRGDQTKKSPPYHLFKSTPPHPLLR